MKNLLFCLILPVMALVFSCNKEQSLSTTETSKALLSDSIKLGPSMKGWELYSWYTGEAWRFSVIPGTNRGKTFEEVYNNKVAVNGIESLKTLFLQIPANQTIFWWEDLGLDKADVIKLPDTKIIEELKTFCLQRELNLVVIPKR